MLDRRGTPGFVFNEAGAGESERRQSGVSRSSQCAWKRKWCAGRIFLIVSFGQPGGVAVLLSCPRQQARCFGAIASLAVYGYQCPRCQLPDEEYPDPTAEVPNLTLYYSTPRAGMRCTVYGLVVGC